MQHSTISAQHHFPFAETLWVMAGVILILAYGDALLLLAVVLAVGAAATGWWVHHKGGHRMQRDDVESTAAQALWRGPTAA
jgi:hypothetical protein